MEKKNTVTVTRIEYQLVEVYNKVEVSLEQLEGLIDPNEDNVISLKLDRMLDESDNIIHYASEGSANGHDWDGSLEEFKIPFIEFSSYMGGIIMVEDSCVSYYMDERIITGDKKTDIHDFSDLKCDTLPSYVKAKRRTNDINDIINP